MFTFIVYLFAILITAYNVEVNMAECNVTNTIIEEVDSSKLCLAEISPRNYQELLLAMKFSTIDRALVGGWNGTKGFFVLNNLDGGVTPLDFPFNFPSYALFYEKTGTGCRIVIGFTDDCFASCCYFEPNVKVLSREKTTICVPDICENKSASWIENCDSASQGGGYHHPPPIVCPQPLCGDPIPSNCPPPPVITSCAKPDRCPFFSQRKTDCCVTEYGQRYTDTTCATSFVLTPPCPGNEGSVDVMSLKTVQTVETVDPYSIGLTPYPEVLADINLICYIKNAIENELNSPICLYTDESSCLFFLYQEKLYNVEFNFDHCGSPHINIAELTFEQTAEAVYCGLYAIEFRFEING